MSCYKVQLDDKYSVVVEGFPTANFVRGDCLEINDRSEAMTKDQLSISLTDNMEYRGGFVKFVFVDDSPVSSLMGELMAKQKKDMKIKKNHSFSVIITFNGDEEFHLKKCLFNLQISDIKRHCFFIVFEEEDSLLKTLNEYQIDLLR